VTVTGRNGYRSDDHSVPLMRLASPGAQRTIIGGDSRISCAKQGVEAAAITRDKAPIIEAISALGG
jgi:hypothetical protein